MKNMRHFFVLWVSLFSLVLFWCGNSWQNMSFSDAYESLLVPEKVEEYLEKTFQNKTISEKTNSNITVSMEDWFLFSGVIKTDSIYDIASWNAEIGLDFMGNAFVPDAKSTIRATLSWKAQTINEKLFLYVDAFDLKTDPATQNDMFWLGFISPIMNTVSKQRIDFSPESNSGMNILSWVSIAPYTANIKQLLIASQRALKTYPLFQEIGKTQIDGKLAYQIGRNPAGVSWFINEILNITQNIGKNIELSSDEIEKAIQDILTSTLSGYIIVYNKNNIWLRIDSLQSQDAWTISLNISTKKWGTFALHSKEGFAILTGNIGRANNNNIINIYLPTNEMQIIIEIPNAQESIVAKIIGSWFNAQIQSSMKLIPLDSYNPSDIKESKSFQSIYNALMWLFWGQKTAWENENDSKEMQESIDELDE